MAQFFEVAYHYRDPTGLIRHLQKTGLHQFKSIQSHTRSQSGIYFCTISFSACYALADMSTYKVSKIIDLSNIFTVPQYIDISIYELIPIAAVHCT